MHCWHGGERETGRKRKERDWERESGVREERGEVISTEGRGGGGGAVHEPEAGGWVGGSP